jgi:2-oxoglutarate dehydrogenase E1 component
LRRQLHREFRKPLIIFSPKSLLRHPKVVSKVEEFTEGKFQEVIDDNYVKSADVRRVLFCSGKIYYDLLEKQQDAKIKDVAIVRIEQMYPTPMDRLRSIKAKYKNAEDFIWVQEEPENMGAWPYICRKLRRSRIELDVICRKESSSPATGYQKQHIAQQLNIVEKAFETNAGKETKETIKKTTKEAAKVD